MKQDFCLKNIGIALSAKNAFRISHSQYLEKCMFFEVHKESFYEGEQVNGNSFNQIDAPQQLAWIDNQAKDIHQIP